MSTPVYRLLPFASADGPHNMAADEILLRAAIAGTASLRFYGWEQATLSLGYFQPERLRFSDDRLAGLPFVRRPSGGDTLVHHHEVTYTLALPAGKPWQTGEQWLCRMHAIIAAALRTLGVPVRLQATPGVEPFAGPLCFRHVTPGDLLIDSAKVVGSAQRRQRGALMQHGGILLRRSPYAPVLPGIEDLSGRALKPEEVCRAIQEEFAGQTGWSVVSGDWTKSQHHAIEELVASKYASAAWNCKR
jgi:lipoyl(octanoyl) transferase